MKKFIEISKAISLAMCMTFALAIFSGCEKENDDPRDAYVGTYVCNETITYIDGSKEFDTYNITITKSTVNDIDVLFTNLLNTGAGVSITAAVTGNSFNIPVQTVTVETMGASLSGSGRREGNTLSFSVLVSVNIANLNYTCVATKM